MSETTPGALGLRSWLRDSGSLTAYQLIATAFGTMTFLLIARSLGMHDFGAFAAVLGVAQAAAIFLDAGFGTFLLRDLTQAQSENDHVPTGLISTALWIEIRIIAVAIPGSTLVSFVITQNARLALLAGLLVLYAGLLTLATTVESYYRAQRRVNRVGTASLAEKLSALIAIVTIVVAGGHDILLVAAALVCSAAVRLALDVSGLPSRTIWRRGRRSSRDDDMRLLRRALPFLTTSTILVVIPRLAVTGVAIVSAAAAAYFALGDRLVNSIVVYCSSLSETLYPHIARGSFHARRALAVQFAVGVAGSVVVALVARPFLELAFRTSNADSIRTVRIMALSIPFTFLASGYLVQAYSRGLESRTPGYSLAAVVIGTAAIIVGVAAWGPTGAAVGYVVRQMLFCAALGLLVSRPGIVRNRSIPVTRGIP